jgi:hypothetical protein
MKQSLVAVKVRLMVTKVSAGENNNAHTSRENNFFSKPNILEILVVSICSLVASVN